MEDKEIKAVISLEKNLHIGRKIKASNYNPRVSAISFLKNLPFIEPLLSVRHQADIIFLFQVRKIGLEGLSSLVIWGVNVRDGVQSSIV